MNDLVAVEGTNESFCDFTICRELWINHTLRWHYPTKFALFILPKYHMKRNARFKSHSPVPMYYEEQSNHISTFSLTMTNLLNISEEIYGRYSSIGSGDKMIHPKIIMGLEDFINKLPPRFKRHESFELVYIPRNLMHVSITLTHINTAAVAYYKLKYPKEEQTQAIIEGLTSQVQSPVPLADYIGGWAKRLVDEYWGEENGSRTNNTTRQ